MATNEKSVVVRFFDRISASKFSNNCRKAWNWTKEFLEDTLVFLWDLVILILTVVCRIFYIATILVAAIILLAGAIISPLWVPFFMFYIPTVTVDMLTLKFVAQKGDWLETLCIKSYTNFLFCTVLRWIWFPASRFLPTIKRQYFINADKKPLKDYPVKVQAEYYRLRQGEEGVFKKMSSTAKEFLWNTKEEKMREALLAVGYPLTAERAIDLLSAHQVELLKKYCNSDNLTVSADVQKMLWHRATNNLYPDADAYDVLLICASKRTLHDELIDLLISSFRNIDEHDKAVEVLNLYTDKKSLKDEHLIKLIKLATEKEETTGKEDAFKIFLKLITRCGLSNSVIEAAYDTENDRMADAVTETVEKLAALDRVKDENLENWREFCQITDDIPYEAQLLMSEKHFEIFLKTGHELDFEAAKELILNKIGSLEKEYFIKVFKLIADKLKQKEYSLLTNIGWKRDIIFSLSAEKKAKEAIIGIV